MALKACLKSFNPKELKGVATKKKQYFPKNLDKKCYFSYKSLFERLISPNFQTGICYFAMFKVWTENFRVICQN